MKECGLTQKMLADVMGATIDRVKGITSGRVHNLTREEGEALIRKLHVRAEWLATGQPPMLQSAGERKTQDMLDKLGSASQTAAALGLTAEQGRLVMELLFFAETGKGEAARKTLADLAKLTPDEAAMLGKYRGLSEKAKQAAQTLLDAAAQSSAVKKKAD